MVDWGREAGTYFASWPSSSSVTAAPATVAVADHVAPATVAVVAVADLVACRSKAASTLDQFHHLQLPPGELSQGLQQLCQFSSNSCPI